MRILGGLSLALALYMTGFTVYSMLIGNHEIAQQTSGGILVAFVGSLLLLRDEPGNRWPKLQ